VDCENHPRAPRDHERGIATPRSTEGECDLAQGRTWTAASDISSRLDSTRLDSTRLGMARSDIFFSLIRRTSAEAAIVRERISLPPASSFTLSRVSRFFSAHRNLRHRMFSSSSPLAWRNRTRYFASRNYQCSFFVDLLRWKEMWRKLFECGEKSDKR